MRVVGIDCAVDVRNVGVAAADWDGTTAVVREAIRGSDANGSIVDWVAAQLEGQEAGILALDAPLGWPVALGQLLSQHAAGGPAGRPPHELFRRRTDHVIRERLNKQPLDVGADRIARTAVAALELLDKVRKKLGVALPVTFRSGLPGELVALEVYPAGTLRAHQIQDGSYKAPTQREARETIVSALGEKLEIPSPEPLLDDADVLDAVVCTLAAVDFLEGNVYEPEDLELARREGWIWVRRR